MLAALAIVLLCVVIAFALIRRTVAASFAAPVPVVVPELVGGLGNQLFIVSTALAYSKRHGKALKLQADIESIPSWGTSRPTYFDTVFRNLPVGGTPPPVTVYEENLFDQVSGDVYLAGYFQEASYFLPFREDILKALWLPQGEPNIVEDDVAVHIRVADSRTPAGHSSVLTTEEVQNSMREAEQLGGCVHVFSNEGAKEGSEIYDIERISQHSHIVVSPSTFCFWAVFLRRNPVTIYIPWAGECTDRERLIRNYRALPHARVIAL